MNAIITRDFETGQKKLNEIINEKELSGHSVVMKRYGKYNYTYEVMFNDGEQWVVMMPNTKGRRFDKVFVDKNTVTLEDLHEIIMPLLVREREMILFN